AAELALLEDALVGVGLEATESRLERFVAGASTRDTSAVVKAWLHHDRRCQAEADSDCSRRTLTRAHLSARTDADRAEVRIALVRQLAREQRWQGVIEVLGTARTPEEAEHLWRAQVAVRDLEAALRGADRWVVPMLEQWTHATRFDTRPIGVEAYGTTVWAVDMDRGELHGHRFDGRPSQTIPLPEGSDLGFGNPHLVPGRAPRLLQAIGGRRTLRLWAIEDGSLRLEAEMPNDRAPLGGWTLADVEGDGQSHLYVGSVYPDRTLWRESLDGSERVPALPSGPSVGSDVTGVDAVDLDADGDDELILSLGIWRGMDLQVFDHRDGALRLMDRARLSAGVRVAVLRRPDGRTFVAAGSGMEGEGIARPSPARIPPGIVIFEWREGRL
ncbi:MAG: hypothetical protein KC656_34020, partial [Myxococcales bacterium]|nr:hypothetical protein [Myxococcales bacterium]